MECFEEELITVEDTGGIELRYGNADAMVKMVEMIAKREGIGDILAEGSAHAAEKIGRGTDEYLITSKNQEAPAHMPQLKRTLALIYAVNPFGADHQSHEHDPSYPDYPERMAQLGLFDPQPDLALNEEMVRYAMTTQYFYSAMDSINVCQFVYGPAWQLYGPDQLVKAAQAVTGWNVSLYELMQVGERRLNMMRAFNAREGIGRESDTLPRKFFNVPLKGGPSDGYVIDQAEWQKAVDTYYAMCGWDAATGHPTRTKLEALGIGWVADTLNL
jgi:aldehyde:ferredoxin oxidoreductase